MNWKLDTQVIIVTNFDFAPKFAIAELGVVNDVNTMKMKM